MAPGRRWRKASTGSRAALRPLLQEVIDGSASRQDLLPLDGRRHRLPRAVLGGPGGAGGPGGVSEPARVRVRRAEDNEVASAGPGDGWVVDPPVAGVGRRGALGRSGWVAISDRAG